MQASERYAPTWAKALTLDKGDKANTESAYLNTKVQWLDQQHVLVLIDAVSKIDNKLLWQILEVAAIGLLAVGSWWLMLAPK